jgi:predicted NAD/FAD-binding protein
MRIAIIGGGISGLYAMYMLRGRRQVTLFEAAPHVGGHVHTVDVEVGGRRHALDAGFIVYNDHTYPRFAKLLRTLGVATQPTRMSFSVRDDASGIEYRSGSLGGLFAQRLNFFRGEIYTLMLDARRFAERAGALLTNGIADDLTLGEHLEQGGYGRAFIDLLVLPMSSAIWSSDPAEVIRFPLREWLGFVDRHGMLRLRNRPEWRVVRGGARRYLDALVHPWREHIRLETPVERVERDAAGVWVTPRGAAPERFDEVVLATHSDQALSILAAPSEAERTALAAIPYRASDVVVHTDESVLPRTRRAWAAWNYKRSDKPGPTVTYNLSELARIDSPATFCVTLNQNEDIDPEQVLRRLRFAHPCYDAGTFAAQRALRELSGRHRIHYCGAYLGHGFHEDGVRSAQRVAAMLGAGL